MQNRLQVFIVNNISVAAVNIVNCFFKTWGRFVPDRMMDPYSLEKFKTYKSDWNYPVQVWYQEQPEKEKGKTSITLQSAIKLTLTIGQCFALNPVLGIHNKDGMNLRFKYKSWRCAYALFSITGQFVLAFLLVISLFTHTSSAVDTANSVIFYIFGVLTTVLFLRIAMKWPDLCRLIAKMEAAEPNTDTKLNRKMNMSCVVVLSLAFLEHIFYELHGMAIAMDCDPEMPLYEAFIRHNFAWMFTYIHYNYFIGFFTHFFYIQFSFNWNYTNLFVICMSVYLTSRLEQINKRVMAAKDKVLPPSFWRTLREDYNKCVQLVRQVDKIIGGVVFVFFACNLFFVCSQLLHTLAEGFQAAPRCTSDSSADARPFRGYEHSIYFAFSFIFLVARSIAVSLAAAKVHAASLEPAQSLYDVPSASYCIEVERFLTQIHGDTVALSGLQFFYVKRGLVLTIAATIVTYELVLMQFTGITPASPEPIQVNNKV